MNTRSALYQARYGNPDVAVPEAASPIIDHLLAHASVRAYLPDPVSDDSLAALASGAASARKLFQRGDLRVDGDVRLAHHLGILNQLA